MVKNNQDNDFNDIKLTKLDSVSIKRDPSSNKELGNKKHIDDSTEKDTILRFNQTLENYLKVSVGKVTYNLTKHDKLQFTDTTFIRNSNTGGYVSPLWKNICNDKNGGGEISNFVKATN